METWQISTTKLSPADLATAMSFGDGEAAKQQLAAGREIFYRDPLYTDGLVRKFPDGRRQIVRIGFYYDVSVVRDL